MSLSLVGYQITRLLRASGISRVYAAVRDQDRHPVVVKVYDLADTQIVETRIEHEFRLIHELEVDNVARVLALERSGTKLALVHEWREGISLEDFAAGQPVAIDDFLDIAEQIARSLADVHAQRVIHGDIKPTSVILDPVTRVISIVDLGIPVLSQREREHINDPAVVEDILPYVSPEQTGRTEREIDFRTDLYSLGATFYELLTGRPPFQGSSPLELIHAHLARRPEPPQRLRPDIPARLSDLVMKLLEKQPEQRYQSARGLRLDLERLARARREGRRLDDFVIGEDDVSMTLQLPHRLYGRAGEVDALIQEFRRAASGGPRFALVTGAAGLGKTALIGQLAGPVISRHGYLARGKFDRELADKPYAGFVAAFTDLAEQLLTETDAQLERWRSLLRLRLGPVAGAICELVPKLETILGPVPALADIGAVEAHSRLALACGRLIAAFARVEHPLVIALDDVHWADQSSCELLAAVLTEPQASLLIVATLQPDELGDDHPIRRVISHIERARMLWLDLPPLERAEVTALIADALSRSTDEVGPLAELIARRTDSSPMLVRQFLTYLVDLDLLQATTRGWTWDQRAVELAGIPDDLLEMMADKLERLDERAREILTCAAVLGTRFELATLEPVVGPRLLGPSLARLVEDGLLTALGPGRYAFTHDRIRDLAYGQTPLERRIALHREVGRLQLERADDRDPPGAVFELVDHLDHGLGLIPAADEDPEAAAARAAVALAELDPSTRRKLAEFNAAAGHKALHGAAAEAALGYFSAGTRLLCEASAELDELALALELGRCEALALARRREAANAGFEALLRRPLAIAEMGRVVAKQVESLIRVNDPRAALDAGLAGLRKLGVDVPIDEGEAGPTSAIVELIPRLAELGELADRPPVRDPSVSSTMGVLDKLVAAAHLTDAGLHAGLVATHLRLVLDHGRHASAPIAVAQAALILGAVMGQRALGLRLISHALALADGAGPTCRRHRIEPTRWILASWDRAYADVLDPLREAAARALEVGDIEFAGYCSAMQPGLALASGLHLRALEQSCELTVHHLQRWGATPLCATAVGHLEFARLMQSGLEEDALVDDPLRVGRHDLALPLRPATVDLILVQALLLYLFRRHREAWTLLLAHREQLRAAALGAWQVAQLLGIEGLVSAALYPAAEQPERDQLLAVLERNHEQLRTHARLGSPNVDVIATLIEGELAGVREPIGRTLSLLSQARRKAASCGSSMLEAITLERIADHARAAELDELALGPLRDARARYHDWGAFTKVTVLERTWPELVGEHTLERDPGPDARSGVDMASILKASQAIAEDIRLEEVVGRVLEIGLENAGADRGVLLLRDEDKTTVVAIATTELDSQSFLRSPIPLHDADARVPISLVHFVERTGEAIVIDDVSADLRFAGDPYLVRERVRSVLCLPILEHSHFVGLLYLENKLSTGSFSGDRLQVLNLLVGQAASSLENAKLYEALRASEVRWRSLVERLPDVVVLVDRRARIEFINHLADYQPRARTIGARVSELIDDAHVEALDVAIRDVIDGAEKCELELIGHFSNQGPRWYAVRLAPVEVDGHVERVIVVATDITERREAETAQARLEATLRQQQRLESIGTLAAGVAHEINNPVQGIMNYAELIAELPPGSDLAREFADEISHESQRVASIVRNLLAFARQESDRAVHSVTIRAIIDGTLSLINAVMRKDQISVKVEIPDGLPEISCQIQQLQQVVMNLITNARDALRARWPGHHEDKRVEIRASTFERDALTWIRLSVEDRGGGVPEHVVSRIFDPFFTTKGRDQGTGLGLAISHGIVKEHGGELRLDNRPGESACFHVELPARPGS